MSKMTAPLAVRCQALSKVYGDGENAVCEAGRHRCTYDGAVCRKGYDYRTLGDRRTDLKETDAHLSKWFSAGISGGIFKGCRP